MNMPIVCMKFSGYAFKRFVPRYTAEHVNGVARMFGRHGFRVHCITDDASGIDKSVNIVKLPKSALLPDYMPKLWLFSPKFHDTIKEPFIYTDLDVIVTDDPSPLFDRKEEFVIWNQAKGELYNSSLMKITPGDWQPIWTNYTPQTCINIRRGVEQGKYAHVERWTGDQTWISVLVGHGAATWSQDDGVIQWRPTKHSNYVPKGTKLAYMCGPFDPINNATPLVARYWK